MFLLLASIAITFPELTGFSDNLVALLQAIGVTLLAAVVGFIALLLLTGVGNQQRNELAKAAALAGLVGFALLMAAPTISTIIQRVFPPK
jgi:zinc transporter ZupT